MNLEQIKKSLEERLSKPLKAGSKRHIIFWYDAKGEFIEEIDHLELANGKIWRLEDDNNFITKYTIEELDPESNYVLYSPKAQPADLENWLLDTLLYSEGFSADRIAMVMKDLGAPQSSRAIFTPYERFISSKERQTRLANYGIKDFTEPIIDRAVLSVLTKQQAITVPGSLRALFCESLNEEENSLWQNIEKFGDPEVFWKIVEREYGYKDKPKTLELLFTSLVITAFSEQFSGKLPETWSKYLLEQKANCVVFVDHFMNHLVQGKDFEKLAQDLEHDLNLSNYIEKWELPEFQETDIFPGLDKAIIQSLLTSLELGSDNYRSYLEIINLRKTKYYYAKYESVYEVLKWAIRLLDYEKEFSRGFPEHSAESLFQAYYERYYKVDHAYRKYSLAYANTKSSEALGKLNERIENLYCNWFLPELSIKWSEFVENELSDHWMFKKVRSQQNFYTAFIEPIASKNQRVFVIISDALRWEIGHELKENLNQELIGHTSLQPLLGVVPSYTQLGMAALLPHQKLEISNSNVLADGDSTSGLENREKILQKHGDAIAVILNDLVMMDRSKVRETFRGKTVAYIYHDAIDAIGDQAKTQEQTFVAAERAIKEIIQAIEVLSKNFTDVNVFVTSDHGFIYQNRPLQESDKTLRGGEQPVSSNRRYMLFDKPAEVSNTLSINMKYLFGMGKDYSVIVPKANNRYKLQGAGDRYVHGGASLQEIALPLINFVNDRKKDASKEVSKVKIQLLNESRRITNSIFTLRFFQTEPVGGKVVERKINAYFVDAENNLISDEISILANRTETNPDHRTFNLRFTLLTQAYDRSATYYLVLEDEDETVENIHAKIPFTLDLGIMHDFDF